MTDKQIIIDGEHDMNYCEDNNCKHYGNKEQCEKTHCYYRCYSKLYTKLKAKEQECEELKEKNKLLIIKATDGISKSDWAYEQRKKKYDQLKAENENWQKEYRKLEQGNDFLAEKNSKLKGCLTEIKEIAEKCRSSLYGYDQERYPKQILQKISEVENG